MLSVNIAHKSFADAAPLMKGFSLHIDDDEVVALVGPSGAGKSTLLNIITGVDTSFKGQIQQSDHRPVGLMFQEPRLMPWLSVLDNVLLATNTPHGQNRLRALTLLEQVGLRDMTNAYPAQLSGGMAKRVALARAVMFNPGTLLLDEPFSSLDAPAAEQLRQLLLSLKAKHGFSIVYVTHDLKEAVAIADRVLLLDANPMTLVHESLVNLPRPRHIHDQAVAAFCQPMYANFPALLSGSIAGNNSM